MTLTKTITSEIGEDYKGWQPGQKILITAPTGTGKTFFILHTLLDYAWENDKKIVYFVNRKILKMQLEEELQRLDKQKYISSPDSHKRDIKSYLQIWTYQSLENHIREKTMSDSYYINYFDSFDYLVCDECHYFYCDSTYNTATIYSFTFLMQSFLHKISIFMSATIENVEEAIYQKTLLNQKNQYLKNTLSLSREELCNSGAIRTYSVETDYSYVSVNLFGKKEDILEILEEYDGKWLIFVDNIEYGRKLERKINEKYSHRGVVFVDADYKKDINAAMTVNSLSEKQYSYKSILIATNVLDNGVSIHDSELRNVVIMSDNRETFLQMLGRKRKDGKHVNLFIPFQSEQFFRQRLNTVIIPSQHFIEKFYQNYRRTYTIRDEYGILRKYDSCCNEDMMRLFSDILNNPADYKTARRLCCFTYPIQQIELNEFAIKKTYDSANYYSDLIEKFNKNGDTAFVRTQLEWLGITEDAADKIIEDYMIDREEKEYKKIMDILLSKSEDELLDVQNKWIKSQIRDSVLYLLKKKATCPDKQTTLYESVTKNLLKLDRTISVTHFNFIMKILDIPFEMEKKGKSNFRIHKIKK